jgi:hypothetical protein
MNEEFFKKVSNLQVSSATFELIIIIEEYDRTGDIKHIHRALDYVESSMRGTLVGSRHVSVDDVMKISRIKPLLYTLGIKQQLIGAVACFMEGERGSASWCLEDFLEERSTDSEDTFDEQ